MGLRLYNTLTRTKQDFVPIDPQNVRMYVCGPTVYDFAHIGNARPLIVFDVLFRLLQYLAKRGEWDGGKGETKVTYVRNITDIDDKIIARAAQDYPDLPLDEAVQRVTETTEQQFHEDVRALGCLAPTVEPRATEHIAEMKAMIETLVEKGYAYVAEDHVLFHVAAMPDYGRLSNRSLDEMVAGARVEVAPYKKDPMDFVLWKPSKQEARSDATGKVTGGEPAWPSPAGIATPGRPGWHLECSAMSDRWLWEAARGSLSEAGLAQPHQFDIHGGGVDLVFPHHENEIAQSRSAHGTPAMANYWLHNGYLQVEGEKMAKSAGNFVTVRELLETDTFGGRRWPGEVLRLAMLMTHYREPLDWTVDRLEQAERMWRRWGRVEKSLSEKDGGLVNELKSNPAPQDGVLQFLQDDMNTHSAIVTMQTLARAAEGGHQQAAEKLVATAEFLGLDLTAAVWIESAPDIDRVIISDRIAARTAARKRKAFAEADRIRDELDAMGIALKDSRNPETGELETTWEVKR